MWLCRFALGDCELWKRAGAAGGVWGAVLVMERSTRLCQEPFHGLQMREVRSVPGTYKE